MWFGPLAQRAPSGQIVRVSPEDEPWWRDLRGVPPEGGVSGRLARAAADHPVRFAAVRTVAVVGPAFVLGIWLVGWRTSLAYVLPSVAASFFGSVLVLRRRQERKTPPPSRTESRLTSATRRPAGAARVQRCAAGCPRPCFHGSAGREDRCTRPLSFGCLQPATRHTSSTWRVTERMVASTRPWGTPDVAGVGQVRVAVVSVTTSGLVTTPPKLFRMRDSMSSSRPSRSDSSIIWVPE